MSLRLSWRRVSVAAPLVALAGLAVYGASYFVTKTRPPTETAPQADSQAVARRAGEILRTQLPSLSRQGRGDGGRLQLRPRPFAPGRPQEDRARPAGRIRRCSSASSTAKCRRRTPIPGPVRTMSPSSASWIEAGAPDFGPAAAGARQSSPLPICRAHEAMTSPVCRNATAASSRYFTLANLRNAGLAEDELETYRQALAKLLNSLSWGREIVTPRPVDAEKTLLRIDLRDYKWDEAAWDRLVADYPYGVRFRRRGFPDRRRRRAGAPCRASARTGSRPSPPGRRSTTNS